MKDLKKYGFNTENKTFVIAEIGINHNGDVNLAKKLIDSAVNSGVDAVKFQTYITEKRVSLDSPIYEILKKCELEFSEFEELKNYSENKGVSFFSTPFDDSAVDFLTKINVEIFKIASYELTDIPLLKKPLEILEKYKEVNGDFVFKTISNQKINEYLKEIAALCEIDKRVSFHLARHTFATTVTLNNNVPIETVSKVMGHSKISTTQIYAKILQSKVGKDLRRLNI